MDDLISRQAVIESLNKRARDAFTLSDCYQYYVGALHDVADDIEQLPSAQPEQRWISATERLPEEGERVLCTHTGGLNPNRQVIEHIYQNGTFTMGWDLDMNPNSPTFGQRYMGGVIAWMPLPEPYRRAGEKE